MAKPKTAEAAAEWRGLIDLFLEIVKVEVPDENARDRIARAILERVPVENDEEPPSSQTA